jgi:hypothetical protein
VLVCCCWFLAACCGFFQSGIRCRLVVVVLFFWFWFVLLVVVSKAYAHDSSFVCFFSFLVVGFLGVSDDSMPLHRFDGPASADAANVRRRELFCV